MFWFISISFYQISGLPDSGRGENTIWRLWNRGMGSITLYRISRTLSRSIRQSWIHALIRVTENYIILPTTSYLLDYCQFFGKFKEFSFRKLASFSSPSIMADLHEKFRPYPAFQLFFNLVFGKNWPRQWLRIVSFFMNMNTLPVKGHVYSVRYINRLNVNGVPLGHELI